MSKFLRNLFIIQSAFILIPSSLHAYEFPVDSCPAQTHLFEHMSAQVDDRIEGVTANNTSKKLFTTRGNLTSPWVWNPDVWTNNEEPIDFTGMSPWNSRGGYTRAGTLITPRHIALANHYTLSVGDTVLFVANDNTVVTRTVSAVQQVLTTDISIAKLNSDVPNTITHYPIIDNDAYEAYLTDNDNMSAQTLPLVVFDQEDKALIRQTARQDIFSEFISHIAGNVSNRGDFNETLVGGDSGNAGFVLIGGKPALVLTHFFSTGGYSYSYYKEDIQDTIDGMGGNYELSSIDLDCFDAPIVLEDNFSLKVSLGSSAGAIVGTVAVKTNVDNHTPYFSFVSGNDDGALAINSSTGVITVANADLIQEPGFPRTIEVGAEANSPGGSLSTKTYSVTFATHPYFEVDEYVFSVDEHSLVGSAVGTIQAYDAQGDPREYSIISGNDAGIFAINSSTGVITVADSDLLNYETAQSHQLIVRAQEDTVQQLFTDIETTVNVNDISYDFSQDTYAFEIAELDENTTVVGTVDSDIVDPLDVASTHYSIISGNDAGIFAINSSTGVITVADNTALDGNQIYNLVIGAREEVGSPVLNSVSVVVTVTHVGRPTLSYQVDEYDVVEGSNASIVFELSAPYTKTIVANLRQTAGLATPTLDYTLSSDTLTFLPGETSKTITFNAVRDSIVEGSQAALVTIVDNTRVSFGLHANATITIADRVTSSGGGGGSSRSSSSKSNTEETAEPETTTEVENSTIDNSQPLTLPDVLPTTIPELQALLTQLRAQLAQALLQQGTPATPGAPTTHSTFTRDLDITSEGEDVRQLQLLLIGKGFIIPAGATGYFGPQTQAALIQYQRANNITPAVGYFGPITRQSIVID